MVPSTDPHSLGGGEWVEIMMHYGAIPKLEPVMFCRNDVYGSGWMTDIQGARLTICGLL